MISEIKTDKIAPIAVPLTHVIRAGDFVYVSGQIPVRPDGTKVIGDFREEVRASLNNISAAVEAAGGTLADVCKANVYLQNAQLFNTMNEVYREYFTEPFPARVTVIAPISDPDIRIEIDAIAYIPAS